MRRSVQILLLLACLVPLFAVAKEETLEERKRRITRKYLRERTNMTYSEMVVPDTAASDEDVLVSEKFKQPQVDLQRQEPGAALPPPAPAPRRVENRNWLLAEDSGIDDPFALKGAKDEPTKKTSGGYSPMEQGRFNPRDPRAYSSEGVQSGILSPNPIGGLDLSRDKTFNSPLEQSRLKNPFSRGTEAAPTDGSFGSGSTRKGGYEPYRSPYQMQRDQRQEQWNGYKQEYQRPDAFKQWKEKNPTRFDPTSDDAFIQETMPKTRR